MQAWPALDKGSIREEINRLKKEFEQLCLADNVSLGIQVLMNNPGYCWLDIGHLFGEKDSKDQQELKHTFFSNLKGWDIQAGNQKQR